MSQPEIWICKTCRRTLDVRHDADGAHPQHTSNDSPADHEPLPIPADETWIPRCDFCSSDEVTHTLPVNDFTVSFLNNHRSSGDWAACTACAELIKADEWDALAQRAVDTFDRATPKDLIFMQILYTELRTAIRGPIVELEPAEEKEPHD